MRFIILTLLVLFTVSSAFSQKRIKKLQEADEYFESEKYAEALELYEILMGSTAGQGVMGVHAKINMADAYRFTGRAVLAKPIYQEILPYVDERPDILLGYGEALMASGQFDEARSYFLQYAEKRPDDPRGADMAKLVDDIQSITPLFDNVEFTYEETVNDSTTDEFGPAYYSTGIVFVSDRVLKGDITANWGEKERSYLNLYFSEVTPSGQLGAPNPFSRRLNSNGRHDGPATFSRDGKDCYYSQSAKVSPDAEEYTLQIFASHLEDGDWNTPAVLEFVLQGHMFSHPCLSGSGKELYFMSDMPGGFGGTDIWVSEKRDGKWTKPKNLGEGINTDKNEAFPFMHPNGDLYFASKGHANYGGYDLFRSRPTGNGEDWTKPQNVGQPFNSAFDDTYFLLSDDQTRGFASSARAGSDNLYSFTLIGAEPAELPYGIAPRGGDVNFIDTAAVIGGANDEAIIDSLLNAGFEVDEPKLDPDPDPEDWDNNINTDVVDTDTTETNNPIADNNDGRNPNSSDNVEEYYDENGNLVKPDPYDPNNLDNPKDPNKDPFGDIDENSPTNPKLLDVDPTKKANLIVELTVVDEGNRAKLSAAQIVVTNVFTREKENYTANSNGVLTLNLKPDQKYNVRVESAGYFGSTLPISTMQAYEDQKAAATVPLYKK